MVSVRTWALWVGAALVMAAAVWRIGVLERRLAPPPQSQSSSSSMDSALPASAPSRSRTPPDNTVMPARGIANVPGVHKCRVADKFVYRDTACPAGTAEHALTAGVVTVIPARPGPSVSSTPDRAPTRPTVRDALVGANEPSLRARQVEQTVNQ